MCPKLKKGPFEIIPRWPIEVGKLRVGSSTAYPLIIHLHCYYYLEEE